LGILAARAEALRKIPPPLRRACCHTGLPLTDCRARERSALPACAEEILRGWLEGMRIDAIAPKSVADGWLSSWSAMVHTGLPSPKAAMFYALGLRSREAAIRCAEHCPEPAESIWLARWLPTWPMMRYGIGRLRTS